MERTITIDGQEVKFRATAAVPRLYRIKFRRDIIQDMAIIKKAQKKQETDGENIPPEALEMFENVAYIMALHGDAGTPSSIDEWLDQFEMFSIYEILPEILELWGSNLFTDVKSRKN